MSNYSEDFIDFEGNVWLNAASEGPLPIKAADALKESIVWKSRPYELTFQKFAETPKKLKDALGELTGLPARDIILGNSASYGLHLIANGLDWQQGDEILLMENDFPSSILPWLALEKKGVKVRQIKPAKNVITQKELRDSITSKTKLFCISHVHTFSGQIADIDSFQQLCKENNIFYVLNVSQSLGTKPIDCIALGADAIVCAGYKWLIGPYGVGFSWFSPSMREALSVNHTYWTVYCTDEELKQEGPLQLKELQSARALDTFGTANFFNFVPWEASVSYLNEIGLKNIESHNQDLIDVFLNELDNGKYDLISEEERSSRSNLVVLSAKDSATNENIHKKLIEEKIFTALWKNKIRLSPHVYNSAEELVKTAKVLNSI